MRSGTTSPGSSEPAVRSDWPEPAACACRGQQLEADDEGEDALAAPEGELVGAVVSRALPLVAWRTSDGLAREPEPHD